MAAEVLATVGSGAPVVNDGAIWLPISGSAGAVTTAVRRLDESGIAIEDIATHRPTLDDVFLTLTGQTATDAEEDEP
jgi:ABC-2 type transport system ATP-binding protein